MNAYPGTRLYANAELGVRFEIDDSFADGPPLRPSPGLPGNVTSAYLAAQRPGGEQAVLSISRVEVGYDTSPQELAEQLVIHNRYAAHTALQNGWTIHSPWKASMLAGHLAMHCDYVVPAPVPAEGPGGGDPAAGEGAGGGDSAAGVAGPAAGAGPPAVVAAGSEPLLAAAGVEPALPGHVQAWVAYVGGQTFQVMLGVNPPGDLAGNRAVVDTVVRTFEITPPGGDDPSAAPAPAGTLQSADVAGRRRLITRGALIAWAVSLAAGIGWVLLLGALPTDFDPVVSLAYSLVGIFGVLIGIGIATGTLVRLLSLGNWPRTPAPPRDDLAPDRVFGLCIILFALPSLLVH